MMLIAGSSEEITAEFMESKGEMEEDAKGPETSETQMQTFVFSATMSKDLQRNLKKRRKAKDLKGKGKDRKPATTLGE